MKTKARLLSTAILLATWVNAFAQGISTVQFSAATYSVSEAGGLALITVVRIGDPGGYAYVEYSTTDVTATDGLDYDGQRGSLEFFGETKLTITIPIINDTLLEGSETVFISLFNPDPFYTELGARSNAVLTILDDEPTVSFKSFSYSVAENAGAVVVAVRRYGSTNEGFSVDYATQDGSATAGADYVAQNGTLTFAAGETEPSFTVSILNDALIEGDENFSVQLGNLTGNVFFGAITIARVRIFDNDRGIGFDRCRYTAREDEGSVTVTVTRAGDPTGPFTIDYTATNGSATAGVDFIPQTGNLSFAEGQLTNSFTIQILDDAEVESDETVDLVLSNPTGGIQLGQSWAQIVIKDDVRGLDVAMNQPVSVQMCQGAGEGKADGDAFFDGQGAAAFQLTLKSLGRITRR